MKMQTRKGTQIIIQVLNEPRTYFIEIKEIWEDSKCEELLYWIKLKISMQRVKEFPKDQYADNVECVNIQVKETYEWVPSDFYDLMKELEKWDGKKESLSPICMTEIQKINGAKR